MQRISRQKKLKISAPGFESTLDAEIIQNQKYFEPDYNTQDLDFDEIQANINNNEKILKSKKHLDKIRKAQNNLINKLDTGVIKGDQRIIEELKKDPEFVRHLGVLFDNEIVMKDEDI